MLKSDAEDRVKGIEKELVKVGIIDALGTVMVGLGLYAKFGTNGDAFHPILNNQGYVNVILAVGVVIMLWGIYKAITLGREKVRLKKNYGI